MKLTPQLVIAALCIAVIAGFTFAHDIDGTAGLAAILGLAGSFGLGAGHEQRALNGNHEGD